MQLDPNARNFTIGFEEDIDPPLGYHTRSLFRSKVADVQPESTLPNNLLSETEISDSYLSAALSTIQPLGNQKSLLILTIICHPAPGRRFVNATVNWRVSQGSISEKSASIGSQIPKIIIIAPQHSVGGWTEEQTTLLWGVSLPVEVGFMGASVGVEPSAEKETQKAVMHAMTILGSIRSGGGRGTWTIEENKSSERGIPSHFQLAVVVGHSGPFVNELDVKAELGGGLWPTYLQAKKGAGGNGLKRTIDVETWKCGEVQWEPGEAGWKKFVTEMTGEVPGVMLEFGQKIVRP